MDTELNLATTYGGAKLQLQISVEGEVTLLVNGISRDKNTGNNTLLVSSTVQTDYEWHELIEGKVSFEENQISAALFANKKELVQENFSRGS